MRRNLTAALALVAIGAGGVAATAVFGEGSEPEQRPDFATVTVPMHPVEGGAAEKLAGAKARSKVEVVYLAGEGQVNTADPAQGGVGAYVDFKLRAPRNVCPRVIDAGINAADLDFFQQGSYVRNGRYHVLMALDDAAREDPAERVTIQYQSHVICLKGTR